MKLKNTTRLSMLIETEGSIRVAEQIQNGKTKSLRICLSIANTDLGIMNWAKSVLEEELNHSIPIYHAARHQKRTKECYQLQLFRLEDVHKILNITRKHMLGVKKRIADLVVSFLNYRKEFLNESGNVKKIYLERYEKAYRELFKKIDKAKQTYDLIKPVTTVRSPDLNDQKIQSGLIGNGERSAEMLDPLEKV